MQLIFLDRTTLKYKDYAVVSSDYEIVVDLVVNQKSNFTLNKESVNSKIGDLAVLKETNINYIGIVETITQNTNKTVTVQLNDFKEIFDVKVPAKSFEGDVCQFLKQKIKEAFIDSNDSRQNLSYLNISVNSFVQGSFSYDDNSFVNILELIELITKTYGILVKYKVSFLRGRFQYINIVIEEMSKTTRLRHDLKAIQNLSIKDSNQYSTNKMIYYPKSDNESHKDTVAYYLLTDGTVTNNKDDSKRFSYVSFDCDYYSDSEYDSLSTKALSAMVGSSSDHEITFDLFLENNVYKPLGNLFLGSVVEFYAPKKTYYTLLTQIKYKGNLDLCYITLGEHRTSLTDKIKLLTKGTKSSSSSVSVSASTDGGEY